MGEMMLPTEIHNAMHNGRLTLQRSAQGVPLAAYFEGDCDEFIALCGVSSLTNLDCDGSAISDACFGYIRKLQLLEELSVQRVNISGRALAALANLPNLRRIVCSPQSFVPEGCAALALCKVLEELDLTFTSLTDSDLHALLSNNTLRVLSLSQTIGLSDKCFVFPGVERLQLQALSVGDTSLGDGTCQVISHIVTLRSVGVGASHVTDEGIRALCYLPELEELRCSATQVTDVGMQYLANVPTLRSLSIARCSITDACIPNILALPNLTQIDVTSTRMSRDGILRLQTSRKWERFFSDLD